MEVCSRCKRRVTKPYYLNGKVYGVKCFRKVLEEIKRTSEDPTISIIIEKKEDIVEVLELIDSLLKLGDSEKMKVFNYLKRYVKMPCKLYIYPMKVLEKEGFRVPLMECDTSIY